MGGDKGGSDTSVLDAQKAEDARKAGLRQKLNEMFGIDAPKGAAPTPDQFRGPSTTAAGDGESTVTVPGAVDDAAYQAALQAYNSQATDPVAAAARDQMTQEENQLADSTRSFYTEDLGHSYAGAKRANTFALADRGLLGGSAQADTERELDRDNTLGATRIEDQVRSAVATLKNNRENERLNATQLINSGSGEDAVGAAQAGLQRALDNAASVQKASIAGDLFQNTADSVAAANNAAYGGAVLGAYRNALKTFYNPSAAGGRITSTG